MYFGDISHHFGDKFDIARRMELVSYTNFNQPGANDSNQLHHSSQRWI